MAEPLLVAPAAAPAAKPSLLLLLTLSGLAGAGSAAVILTLSQKTGQTTVPPTIIPPTDARRPPSRRPAGSGRAQGSPYCPPGLTCAKPAKPDKPDKPDASNPAPRWPTGQPIAVTQVAYQGGPAPGIGTIAAIQGGPAPRRASMTWSWPTSR